LEEREGRMQLADLQQQPAGLGIALPGRLSI
jgi:hypothetical protein